MAFLAFSPPWKDGGWPLTTHHFLLPLTHLAANYNELWEQPTTRRQGIQWSSQKPMLDKQMTERNDLCGKISEIDPPCQIILEMCNAAAEPDFWFCFQEIFLQGSPELSQTSKPQNQVCDVYNDGYNVMMIPNVRLNFKIDVEKICSYQRMILHKTQKENWRWCQNLRGGA